VEPDQLGDSSKMHQFLRSSEFKQIEGTLEGEQSPTGRADSISSTIRAIHNRWEATRPRYWEPEVLSKAQDRRDQEWRDLPIRQLRGHAPQELFAQDLLEPEWFSTKMSAAGDVPTDALDVLKVGHPQWWMQKHPRLQWLSGMWTDARVRLTLCPAQGRVGEDKGHLRSKAESDGGGGSKATVPTSDQQGDSRRWSCPSAEWVKKTLSPELTQSAEAYRRRALTR
jgi:hypothetical protein